MIFIFIFLGVYSSALTINKGPSAFDYGLLAIGFVVHYSFLKYFDDVTLPVVIYIAFFLSVVIFGFWAGRKDWKKDKGAILERIRKIREEME